MKGIIYFSLENALLLLLTCGHLYTHIHKNLICIGKIVCYLSLSFMANISISWQRYGKALGKSSKAVAKSWQSSGEAVANL